MTAARRTPWLFMALAALLGLLALCIATAVAVFLFTRGGPERPRPLRGDAAFTLTLRADERFGAGDADEMLRRLTQLGAEAEVTGASRQEITLRVDAASSQSDVLRAIEPRVLGLHLFGPGFPQDQTLPPGLDWQAVPYAMGPATVAAGDCRAAEAFAALDIPGCFVAVEGRADAPTDEPGPCRALCLDPEPLIASRHVADAEVSVDENMGQPVVLFTTTDEGADRLERGTAANIGKPLVIVVDARVMSTPTIQAPFGAEAMLTLGSGDQDELMLSGWTLAEALRTRATIAPWTLVAVR